jgi:DNA-binding transcriptional LysR family regulator
MDRLESMTLFCAAIEAGSLSAAARELGVPLATVSRKVSELEEHLRTRLLNRTSRKLSLTDAGREYLASCQSILEQIEAAERSATGEYRAPKGGLILTAPLVFGRLHVLPIVTEFLKAFPEIDVRLVLSDRVINLFEEHVDAAVRVGALPDSSLMAIRLGAIQRVTCASTAYLRERGTPRQPAELNRHDCITFEGLSSPREWSFDAGKAATRVRLRSRLVVNTAEAAIDAAVAGLGVTRVLSYQVAAAEAAGHLTRILRKFESAPTPVHLVHAGHSMLPLKLRAFLDYCAPRLKERLSSNDAE